jgi:uncharacterized coiled-coil protein SlyX
MTHTQSATPLARVQIVRRGYVNDVWLRRNIEEVDVELPEGGSQHFWEADEAFGILPGYPTVEGVEDQFDELWARFEDESLTDAERIADARDTASTNSDAIAELADMVAEGEVTMEDLSQAIVELAEIIGGGE